ncbi:MAG: OmpA family protein [Bacteroidales bacterium]|nr:OmpA family protein [Bacteroidales bacterium]
MKKLKHFILSSILIVASIGQIKAQTEISQLDINLPNEYKPLSFYISGNGLNAIGSFEFEGTTKFIQFSRNNNKFDNPQEIYFVDSLVSNNQNPFSPCFNHDASRIYFSAKNENNNYDIYYSDKIKGKWSLPIALDDSINSESNEMWPSISSDGLSLYFVRVTDENISKKNYSGTIYLSDRLPEKTWKKAVKLTESLTIGSDMSPYIAQDNKTLYFSSVREDGLGENDIYYACRVSDLCWILPVPITNVNTSLENKIPSFDPITSNLVYLNQDLKKKDNFTLVKSGIVMNYYPKETSRFHGKIINQITKTPMEANIVVSDAFSSSVMAIFKSNDVTGEYDFVLPKNNNHIFIDYSYPEYSHTIIDKVVDKKEDIVDVSLFRNVELFLNVFDKTMLDPISTEFEVTADGEEQDVHIENLSLGRYKLTIPIGKKYSINISQDLYEPYYMDLDLSQTIQFRDFERDIELNSQKEPVQFQISGVTSPIEIEIINLSTNERRITIVTTDEKGNVTAYLRKGDKYQVNIMPKGYSFYNGTLDLTQNKQKYEIATKLEPLIEDVKMQLNNITFETNSADITSTSYEELERLVDLLKINNELKVEISAHTDDKGSESYNLKLSERRAVAVVSYLKGKGIFGNRLVTKGYGKSMPLVPNTSDENRAVNRRVEFKIISIEKNN